MKYPCLMSEFLTDFNMCGNAAQTLDLRGEPPGRCRIILQSVPNFRDGLLMNHIGIIGIFHFQTRWHSLCSLIKRAATWEDRAIACRSFSHNGVEAWLKVPLQGFFEPLSPACNTPNA